MRVALLTNILPPYRIQALEALAATPDLALRVLVNAETEFDRPWEVATGGLDVERVPSRSRVRSGRTVHLPNPWRLLRVLARWRPDVVISGELGARTLLAWIYCLVARRPLAVWGLYNAALLARAGSLTRLRWRFLARRARVVVAPGQAGRRAFRALGVPDARIVLAPNCHDVTTFAKALAALDRDAARSRIRTGIRGRARIALVAGRMIPGKGIEPLLDAWDRLPPQLRGDWTLLFVGDGPLAGRVVETARARRAGEIARLPAVRPHELAAFYAAADLLLFPSLIDVWGLVVNEAMACGLPVLCSTRAGCAEELIAHGETGWCADPLDAPAFDAALREALTCGRRRRIAGRACERIARFTPSAMAHGFRLTVQRALEPDA